MKYPEDDFIDTDGYDPEARGSAYGGRQKRRRSEDERGEEDIEYSALPRVDDLEGFTRATLMANMIRLDEDLLDWLKSGGLDYEVRANAIIRRQMILDRGLLPPAPL